MNHKGWLVIGLICFMLLGIGLFSTVRAGNVYDVLTQTGTTDPWELGKGDFYKQAWAQETKISQLKTRLAQAPISEKAKIQWELNYENGMATVDVRAITMAATIIANKKTGIAQLTTTPQNLANNNRASGVIRRTEGFKANFTNPYIARDLNLTQGAWLELDPSKNEGLLGSFYFAGDTSDGSALGVIVREQEAPEQITRYVINMPTGPLTITGKQGTFLVLKQANGSPLYFDIVTHQFALSPMGTITPLATAISPQMKQSTPQPASNNPATAYPAVP